MSCTDCAQLRKDVAEALREAAGGTTWEQAWIIVRNRILDPQPEPLKIPEIDWQHFAAHDLVCDRPQSIAEIATLARLIVDGKVEIVRRP